jgi:hypothetical protein
MDLQVSREDAAEELFLDVERAYRAEDEDAYLSFIDTYMVWVGRGRHLLSRARRVGDYLRGAIPRWSR